MADDEAHTVFAIAGLSRLIEQVATQLADVAERRGIDAADFIPEACSAELAAERERTTGAEHRAPRHRQRVVVVQRQRAIQHIVATHAHSQLANPRHAAPPAEIARAPSRERVCQYV